MRNHYVTFYSPGTLFSESTTKPIAAWDAAIAVQMSEKVTERYGARPYAFKFLTRVEADPVPDGEGGKLNVEPRTVEESGMHFLGGTVLTIEDVERRAGDNEILLSNMRCNGYLFVVEKIDRFRTTHPLQERDVVVDATGKVVERGDSPERAAVRKRWEEAQAWKQARR